ncbi:DUF2341 domain-containing protein, partial [Patescibacteria group bacterium]|nr:DUF2341 domain-containing protein [Patescibacteria group bacterium]
MKITSKVNTLLKGTVKFKHLKINKKVFLIFAVLFSIATYYTCFQIFPKLYAATESSITKDSEIDWEQGTLTDLEISGSGNPAFLQLQGDGGVGWFDTDWKFRKQVTVTNSGTVQTNYQVRLDIEYDTSMQSDFDDLRFANDSGEELDYWLQSRIDSDSAVAWVEIDTLAGSGDTTIYMYYGNETAASGSNGEEVFLLFDDFESGIIDDDKWTLVDQVPPGEIYIANGKLMFARLSNDTWNKTVYADNTFPRSDISFEMDYQWMINNASYDALMIGWHDNTAGTSYTNLVYAYYNHGSGSASSVLQSIYEDGSSRGSPTGHYWTVTTDYDVRVRMRETGGAYYDYSTDSGETWTTAYTSSYSTESNVRPGWAFYSGTHEFDNVRVRKWMTSEPTSFTGTEESALPPTGSWESPADSNVIDLIWNGGWGNGEDSSTAFSATVANVGVNSSVTFQMRVAETADDLSLESYATLGIANSGTTFTRTKAELEALGLSDGSYRYVQVKTVLTSSDGLTNPQLDSFTINYLSDNEEPELNGTNIQMLHEAGGDVVTSDDWTNGEEPYFTWTAGADYQSGLKGYCLYLGIDSDGDPSTAKGILGNSPVSTEGSTCQFILGSESVDFSLGSIQGSPWLTSSNDTYYFKLKAIDNFGNIFTGDPEEFSFRFDNTNPANPGYISTPSNFISTKEATVTWPTAGGDAPSDNHSGLAGLQYKIGSSGVWYGDSHTGTQDLDDLLANDGSYTTQDPPDYDSLIEGSNIIYFRTLDNAGNISSTYVSGALKINTFAPSSPQNLYVTPENNTANSYSFDWNPPATYIGQVTNITYCYTVNTLPSGTTCNFTPAGVTNLAADAYATQPGVNTFYVVARDEALNINYDTYATVDFTYSGSAPGIPRSTDVSDISIKSTANWKLAVSWDPPENMGIGIAHYNVYRSTVNTTCTSNFAAFTKIGSISGTTYADTNLTQQQFYYCVKSCDSANNCSAVSQTDSEYPDGKYTEPPVLLTGPEAHSITTRRATISWITDRTADSKIAFGQKSGEFFEEEPSIAAPVIDHEITLSGLEPDTTYYYVGKWTDEDGNTGISSEKVFKTDPAPIVKDVEVKSIGLNNALIEF